MDRRTSDVWDILEKVIKGTRYCSTVLLRFTGLGIQAFQPVLIEGKAIRLHPLVLYGI